MFLLLFFVFNNKEPTDSKVQVKDEANVVVVVGGVVVVDVVVDVVTFVFGKWIFFFKQRIWRNNYKKKETKTNFDSIGICISILWQDFQNVTIRKLPLDYEHVNDQEQIRVANGWHVFLRFLRFTGKQLSFWTLVVWFKLWQWLMSMNGK